MLVNISLIVLKKMYDILMIFVDFCWNFPWFQAIFCYPDPDPDPFIKTDPDPADQNETDPNGSGSGSATLHFSNILKFTEQEIKNLNSENINKHDFSLAFWAIYKIRYFSSVSQYASFDTSHVHIRILFLLNFT